MPATKCQHVARIHEDASFFLDRFLESLGSETGNAWKISKHFGPVRVHSFHYGIVVRDRRRGFDRKIAEAFRVSELQKFIEFPFVTDGTAQARTDVGAARRACAVIGINDHMIRKLEIEIVQRVELLFGELLRVFLP